MTSSPMQEADQQHCHVFYLQVDQGEDKVIQSRSASVLSGKPGSFLSVEGTITRENEPFQRSVSSEVSSVREYHRMNSACCSESFLTLTVPAPLYRPPDTSQSLRKNLTMLLSTIYAIFVVTVGTTLAVADVTETQTQMGEAFMIYLLVLGILWFLFFHIDLLRQRSSKHRQVGVRNQTCHEASNAKGEIKYAFSHGRHSGSFFLKIGAAGFCLGHLVHIFLLLSREISHFISSDHSVYEECADLVPLMLYLLYPIYSFYQLLIIFKYSNVIINRFKEVSRFGLMHCLATNLYFWVHMIIQETVHSLQHDLVHTNHIENASNYELIMNLRLFLRAKGRAGRTTDLNQPIEIWNGTILDISRCSAGTYFSSLLLDLSPYLYPFSIEYNILVVGIWIIMWQNIGKRSQHCLSDPNLNESTKATETAPHNTLVLYADCHSASRGLFAGLLIIVGSVVSIVLFFMVFTNEQTKSMGILINVYSDIALLVLMLLSTVMAFKQVTQLDTNHHAVSLLDDMLLLICIPCFFLYGVVTILPAVTFKNYLNVAFIVVQVVQVLVQTPFIIDGLRRCSNNPNLGNKKPGRELITFLIVCNIAVWLIETFEIKSQETDADRILYYGYPMWIFLSHITLPLTLFYRFHSSVCLVDIWKSAYERGH